MGTKTWADGDVPSGADFNTYFRDQVVTICTSGTRPTTSQDGRPIFETDTSRYYQWDTTASAWENGLWCAGWTAWTPTLTQSATITTTTDSAYMRAGRLVTARFTLTASSAGTASNYVTINLPVTAKTPSSVAQAGSFMVIDAGTILYAGALVLVSGTTARFLVTSQSDYLGVAPAYTIASTDTISGVMTYEAAAG